MPTSKMLRTIFGVAKQFGIDNEGIHDAIEAGFQKKSLKDLTHKEVLQLLEGFRGRRYEPGNVSGVRGARRDAMGWHGRRHTTPDQEFFVNEREMRMLAQLADEAGWTEESLQNFILRQTQSRGIKTLKDFNKVLWGLKSILRRKNPNATN